MKPICIYHGKCADGFTSAWAVHKALGNEVEFVEGVYQNPPPNVKGRDVIMVDFSYKRPVLLDIIKDCASLLILDHHKTAQEDLAGFPSPRENWGSHFAFLDAPGCSNVGVHFNMAKSGALITWEFFHPTKDVP